MSTQSTQTNESALREYSALVETWWPDAGDTHELLAARELLHLRLGQLTAAQVVELHAVDAALKALMIRHAEVQGWDIAMLRKTFELIQQERAQEHRQAA